MLFLLLIMNHHKRERYGILPKAISMAVVCLFLLNDIVWAYPDGPHVVQTNTLARWLATRALTDAGVEDPTKVEFEAVTGIEFLAQDMGIQAVNRIIAENAARAGITPNIEFLSCAWQDNDVITARFHLLKKRAIIFEVSHIKDGTIDIMRVKEKSTTKSVKRPSSDAVPVPDNTVAVIKDRLAFQRLKHHIRMDGSRQIRAILFDLDDTAVTTDKETNLITDESKIVNKKIVAFLAELAGRGVLLGICTNRKRAGAMEYAAEIIKYQRNNIPGYSADNRSCIEAYYGSGTGGVNAVTDEELNDFKLSIPVFEKRIIIKALLESKLLRDESAANIEDHDTKLNLYIPKGVDYTKYFERVASVLRKTELSWHEGSSISGSNESFVPVKCIYCEDNIITILPADADKGRARDYFLRRHGLSMSDVLILVDQPQKNGSDEAFASKGAVTVGEDNSAIPDLVSTDKAIVFEDVQGQRRKAIGPEAFLWVLQNANLKLHDITGETIAGQAVNYPVFIASPSGAGKDALFNQLKHKLGNKLFIVPRLTTRPKRHDDDNSNVLHFTTREDVLSRYERGEIAILEENYGGALYATEKFYIDDNLRKGKIVVIVGNAHEGLDAFCRLYPQAATIFISPVSDTLNNKLKSASHAEQAEALMRYQHVVEDSILGRGRDEAENTLSIRLDRAVRDIQKINCFDVVFSNERDSMGLGGASFRSTIGQFTALLEKVSRQGSGGKKTQSGPAIPQKELVFFAERDSCAKKDKLIAWLKEQYPQAQGLVQYFSGLQNYEQELFFSHVFRLIIVPSKTPFVRLLDEDGIFEFSELLLQEDVMSIKQVFAMHLGFDLLYDHVHGPWLKNRHLQKAGLFDGQFIDLVSGDREKTIDVTDTRGRAIGHLRSVASGKFVGISPRHQAMAAQMLRKAENGDLLKVLERAVASKDWYLNRLAQEALSMIDPSDPERRKIITLLAKGIGHPKGNQITRPSLTGLINMDAVNDFEDKLLETNDYLAMDWGRERETRLSLVKALSRIGNEAALQGLIKDISDQDLPPLLDECIRGLPNFPLEKVIDMLILQLDNPSEKVRKTAKESLINLGVLSIERLVSYYHFMTPEATHNILDIFAALSDRLPLADYLAISKQSAVSDKEREFLKNLELDLRARDITLPDPSLSDINEAADIGRKIIQNTEGKDIWFAFYKVHNYGLRYAISEYCRTLNLQGHFTVLVNTLGDIGNKYRELYIADLIETVKIGYPLDIISLDRLWQGSPPQRAAAARVLPYLPERIRSQYLPELLNDPDWFVRKECLYAILAQPGLELSGEQITVISQRLLDDIWINRYLAMLILKSRCRADLRYLRNALSQQDWRVSSTAVPLISLFGSYNLKEESFQWWTRMFESRLTSLSAPALDAVNKLGIKSLSYMEELIIHEDAAVRLNGVSIMRAMLKKNAKDMKSTEFKRLFEIMRDSAHKEGVGYVRAAFYIAISDFTRLAMYENVHKEAVNFLNNQLESERNTIARWALIEALNIQEPAKDRAIGLGQKENIKKDFISTINSFNQYLAVSGHNGKISEIILMDSSFTKPQAEFIIGSDLDFLRIIYTGDVPDSAKKRLRESILDLGIFLEQGDPQWIDSEKRQLMHHTATDLVIYKDGKAIDKRTVINDFLEPKSMWRAILLDLIEKGALSEDDIALSRKIHRAYALSRYYGIDTPLMLKGTDALFALCSVLDKGLFSLDIIQGADLAIKGSWFQSISEPLPIFFEGKPLSASNFNDIRELYRRKEVYRIVEKKTHSLSSLFPDKDNNKLTNILKRNDSFYQELCNSKKHGFDIAVITVKGVSEAEIYNKEITQLKIEKKIPQDLEIVIVPCSSFAQGEMSAQCLTRALQAVKERLMGPPGLNKENAFIDKKIIVLDYTSGTRGPFEPAYVDGRVFLDKKMPLIIQVLKGLSGISAMMPEKGGIIVVNAGSAIALDALGINFTNAAVEPLVFDGDFAQAMAYGVHITDGNLTRQPVMFQKKPDIMKLNTHGLVFYHDRRIRIRNVDSGVVKLSTEVADSLVNLAPFFSDSNNDSLPIPLSDIYYALSWPKERFIFLQNGKRSRKALSNIWDQLHEKGKWEIANVARIIRQDDQAVLPGETTQGKIRNRFENAALRTTLTECGLDINSSEGLSIEFLRKMEDLGQELKKCNVKGQSLIIYADDIIENMAICDLEHTIKNIVTNYDIFNGGKIIIYARNKTNAVIVEKMVKRAGPDPDAVKILCEDLRANRDEIKEIETVIRFAKEKGAHNLLGVVRGPASQPENLSDFSRNSDISIIIVGLEKGIYSFAQAIHMLINAKTRGYHNKPILLPLLKFSGDSDIGLMPSIEDISRNIFMYEESLLALSSGKEKIPTVIVDNYDALSKTAADEVVNLLKQKPDAVIGLTAGNTPIGMYKELVKRHKNGEVDFQRAIFIQPDSYLLDPSHPQSYRRYLNDNFFEETGIRPDQVYLLEPGNRDPHKFAVEYEQFLNKHPIDLLVLGIGGGFYENGELKGGHICFNEPGSSENSVTRVVNLTPKTRWDASFRFNSINDVPKQALTIGISTVMKARRVVLLVAGEDKAPIIKAAIENKITSDISSTFLQKHANAICIMEEGAALALERRSTPWIIPNFGGIIDWSDLSITGKAADWLSGKCGKTIGKLSINDYKNNGLGSLISRYNNDPVRLYNVLKAKVSSSIIDGLLPMNKKIVIFSPHPDDDVICCGGMMQKLKERGNSIVVCYMTSGAIAVREGNTLDEKRMIREEEARRAMNIIGCETVFLDLPFYYTRDKGANISYTDQDVEAARKIFVKYMPDIVFRPGELYDPHGTHGVCDHIITEALNMQQMPGMQSWTYRSAWGTYSVYDHNIVVVPLTQEEHAIRMKLIGQHKSQEDLLFPGADFRTLAERVTQRSLGQASQLEKLGLLGPDKKFVECFMVNDLKHEPAKVADKDDIQLSNDMYDAEHAAILIKNLIYSQLQGGRSYEIKYDASRLSVSQIAVIEEYVKLLQLNSSHPDSIKLKPFSSIHGSTESLIAVYCIGKNFKGEGHVEVTVPEGELKDYLLKITGMLNIALASSNIPDNLSQADVDEYRPITDYIKSQYKLILGEELYIPSSSEGIIKIIRIIVLNLPKSIKRDIDKIEMYNRLAIEALIKA